MNEDQAKQAADDLHNAICTMETIYEDVKAYLEHHADKEEAQTHAYKLLENVKALLIDIGEPYTKLAAYTNE